MTKTVKECQNERQINFRRRKMREGCKQMWVPLKFIKPVKEEIKRIKQQLKEKAKND